MKTIDQMASEAGLQAFQKLLNPPVQCFEGTAAQLTVFASLVAAAERESWVNDAARKTLPNLEAPSGMTVAELKTLVKDWPETDAYGDPCEVWLCGADGLSNQAREAGPLNMRRSDDGTKLWADLMLEHDA